MTAFGSNALVHWDVAIVICKKPYLHNCDFHQAVDAKLAAFSSQVNGKPVDKTVHKAFQLPAAAGCKMGYSFEAELLQNILGGVFP